MSIDVSLHDSVLRRNLAAVQTSRILVKVLDSENDVFNLKPGKSWVHVVQLNNPVSEVAAGTGSETQSGSGNWKLPYISPTPLDDISLEGILNDLP